MLVSVEVKKRAGFEGFWIASKLYAAGVHQIEVAETEVARLKLVPVLAVSKAKAQPVAEKKEKPKAKQSEESKD